VALSAGQRLGPYEVLVLIGEGGMGQVYRARDTKLNREVALKALPEALAGDADRLARFRREAQVLASLNHPNIAHIHGFEDSGSTHALVMELVEGPTLAERIAQGPIGPTEALPIARQIADALEAAHEQGIVHRDLKPANIKVRNDGTVKVLDFGLAKALDTDPAGSAAAAMNSPTLTARATQIGVILGTAAYMAPEQARGRAVDRRADIWAFGVVLYEMLTGRRAFDGDDISITLANVLKEDVNWSALPADLPVSVRRLLRRCLEKDPKRRLSAMGDARLEMDESMSGTLDAPAVDATAPARRAETRSGLRAVLPWAAAGLFGAGFIASLVLWAPWRPSPSLTPRRLLTDAGAEASIVLANTPSVALSPDGITLAFVAVQGGATRLFVRKLDQLQAIALPGTEGATAPFFSPNGQWIAFFAGASLKKVSVTGGAALPLCDSQAGRGGWWAENDTIFFTPSGATGAVIMKISAAGGTAVAAGALSEGAGTQRWPQVLPGDAGVLFTEHSATSSFDGGNIVVMPMQGGKGKILVRGGYFGRYVKGYLLYMQQGTMFAAAFDAARLEVTGQAVPVLQGVAANSSTGAVHFAFGSDGSAVYVPGTATAAANPIDWVARDGKTSPLRSAKAEWGNPRFSPDGQKLAMDISDGRQRDIWVYDWSRDTLTQLTFDPSDDLAPVWTPDSRRIVFGSDRANKSISNLYSVNADGTGTVTRLTDSAMSQFPYSWHPSGKYLAFYQLSAATSWDIMILPMEGDAVKGWTPGKSTTFLATPALEIEPMFSPDGRWIAYFSSERVGAFVYVRPFPGPGGIWKVAPEGGAYPSWSRTANELLFTFQNQIWFAPYTVVGDSFRAEKPQPWTPTHVRGLGTPLAYDIHPDGKRLAAIAATGVTTANNDNVVFVFSFLDYLKATVAAGKR